MGGGNDKGAQPCKRQPSNLKGTGRPRLGSGSRETPMSTLVPLQRPDPRSLALGEGREGSFGDSSLTLQGFFGSG